MNSTTHAPGRHTSVRIAGDLELALARVAAAGAETTDDLSFETVPREGITLITARTAAGEVVLATLIQAGQAELELDRSSRVPPSGPRIVFSPARAVPRDRESTVPSDRER